MMTGDMTEEERTSIGSIKNAICKGVASLDFIDVRDYTTFLAEFAIDGEDIILHFYRSPEREKDDRYWLQVFPRVLDVVARDVFDAAAPRLTAAYTEEMDSWWLRARGYQYTLDKAGLVLRFIKKLDQMLDTTIST